MVRPVGSKRLPFFSLPAPQTIRLAVVCLMMLTLVAPAEPEQTLAQTSGPAVTVTKALISPVSGDLEVDDPVTFQITLANTGSTTIDVLPLADTFDPTYLRFTDATVNGVAALPDLQTTSVISWADLTLFSNVGNLAPGGSVAVVTRFIALAATTSGGGLNPPTASGPPGTPLPGTTVPPLNPNDYYDKETRFLIDRAIDQTNGGVYLAVRGDGTPWGAIPDTIYGFAPNFFQGTTKHPGGQALCVEYFIREYQRLTDTGRTVATQLYGVQTPLDMLTWAKECADFVNAHMIIGQGQNEPNLPACTPGDGNRCLYYWGFVDAAGTSGHMPPVGTGASYSAPNSHHLMDSYVAWMQAELARVLYANGDPSYMIYRDASLAFLNWAQTVGPPYNATAVPANPSYAGRDRFWAGLLLALYELSVDEGAPDETLRTNAINCVNLQGSYAANVHQRGRCNGTSYTTAYGRSAAHAMELQNRGVDNYYLPGARPDWHNFGETRYGDNPATPNNPTVPFAHGSGRELIAGLQRLHWFYYTFPNDPDPSTLVSTVSMPGSWSIESWSRYAILGHWQYSIENMWDSTPGQEAWWDAQLRPNGVGGYKPCFSLGTPVPIADWHAPSIGDKVHTVNPDGSATVTVSGVDDPPWEFVSWKFRGIGVTGVRVFYSIDDGATWTGLQATPTTTPGIYVATIPPQPGQTVRYYAEAEDGFGNISTFPSNAPQVYQLYTLRDVTYNMAWSVGGRDTDGVRTPGDSDDISLGILPKQPTAITLSRLDVQRQADGVQITWETSSENNTFGFNIYRSATGQRADAVQLNRALLPSQGAGTRYSFLDNTPLAGPASYWLEEIDLSGRSSWHRVPSSLSPAASTRVLLPVVRR